MSFKEYSIGDVCQLGDGAHSKVLRVEKGVPYLTSKVIKNGNLILDNVAYISGIDYLKIFCESQQSVRHLQKMIY